MNNRFPLRIRTTLILPFLVLAITLAFVLSLAVTASASSGSSAALVTAEYDLTVCPWMDTSLTADQRARLLLDASTLEQIMRWLVEPSANNPTRTDFGSYTLPEQVPCTPFIQFTDSPHGVTSRGVTNTTAFPAQIGLAATWDQDLSWLKGQAHGYEAFYKMNNVVLGPGLASGRVPYLGRNSEYFGEDPLLGGLIAAAMTRGMQEGNSNEPVEAVLKHYTANEQELDRRDSSSNMDERTLRQIYTLPYEIAIKESNPGGVMCAFNQINGDFSCESDLLLNTILKGEIGFDGWVVSDFFGVYDAAKALNAGFDHELVGGRIFNPENLYALLASGEITEEMIYAAAFRVVHGHIAAGLFDHPLPPERLPDVSTPENQAVAQRIAEEGSVLLKNEDGILPLDSSVSTIAVIGPTAAITETNGVNAETAACGSGQQPDCDRIETPLVGITNRAAVDGSTVVFDNGSDFGSAAATAASADVAIVFGYYTQGEGSDLENLSLVPQTSTSLFEDVSAGDTNVKVSSFDNLQIGSTLVIDTGASQEKVTVAALGTEATDTVLGLLAEVGDTNIKVPVIGGLVAGDLLSIDTGANLEIVTVTDVGTGGATSLDGDANVGDDEIDIDSAQGFSEGDTITIGSGANAETRTIVDIGGGFGGPSFDLDAPLNNDHSDGESVTGSGITFAPALSQAHEAGAAVRSPGTGITIAPALSQSHAEGASVFASYGDDLISTVAAANPNTIVILQTGGPVLMPWVEDVKGIFETWYAGQEIGPALAALLWGDVNPSGKLPQTFPVSEDDLPTAGSEAQYPGIVDAEGIRQVDYTEGMEVGYRWYDAQGIEPLFPFGHGLSYTTFEYVNMQVIPRVQEGRDIRVRFGVVNTGSVAGSEIAQVYLSLPSGLGEPPKRLVGWVKVTLEPGEREWVTLSIDPDSSDHPMSYWDTSSDSWVTPTGSYTVHVGSSSSSSDLMSRTVRVFPRDRHVGH